MPYPETDIDGHPWPQPDFMENQPNLPADQPWPAPVYADPRVIHLAVTRDIGAGEEIPINMEAPVRRPVVIGEWGARREGRVPWASFGFNPWLGDAADQPDTTFEQKLIEDNPDATLRVLFTKVLETYNRTTMSDDAIACLLLDVMAAKGDFVPKEN
jgi:hypothetical protein